MLLENRFKGCLTNIKVLFCIMVLFLVASCKDDKRRDDDGTTRKYSRFVSYKSFNDKPELHMAVAEKKGTGPLQSRDDTLKYARKLRRLPEESDVYKLDKLTHSVPFLIDDASKLLTCIGQNFKDSLRSKKLPHYKLVVTSVTRTRNDVANLSKRNMNASENSVHCYGTTFDVSWKRFHKAGSKGDDNVSPDRLKYVLGEVLHDLRQRDKCYVVHEKKQACFHITVR